MAELHSPRGVPIPVSLSARLSRHGTARYGVHVHCHHTCSGRQQRQQRQQRRTASYRAMPCRAELETFETNKNLNVIIMD